CRLSGPVAAFGDRLPDRARHFTGWLMSRKLDKEQRVSAGPPIQLFRPGLTHHLSRGFKVEDLEFDARGVQARRCLLDPCRQEQQQSVRTERIGGASKPARS